MPANRRSQRKSGRSSRDGESTGRRSRAAGGSSRRSSRESRRSERVSSRSDDRSSRRSRSTSSRREERTSRRDGRDSKRSRRQSTRSKRVDDYDDDDPRESRRMPRQSVGFMGLNQEQQIYAGVGGGAVLLLLLGAFFFMGGDNDDYGARRRARRSRIDQVQMGGQVQRDTPTTRRPFRSTQEPFKGNPYQTGFGRGNSWAKIAFQRGSPTPEQIRLVASNMTADYNMTSAQESEFVRGFVAAAKK